MELNNKETERLLSALERIATALESIPQPAPDIVRDICHYSGFNWNSIHAEVLARDKHGAIAVRHSGKIYTRRSPVNKFGVAIWYSRATGKDGDETTYERLITFKEVKVEADPLPEKTLALLRTLKQNPA